VCDICSLNSIIYEKEFPPKPLGGWWLKFTVNSNQVSMSVERAD
jgi:hypothetical protein